eukprot:gene4735-biopygen4494
MGDTPAMDHEAQSSSAPRDVGTSGARPVTQPTGRPSRAGRSESTAQWSGQAEPAAKPRQAPPRTSAAAVAFFAAASAAIFMIGWAGGVRVDSWRGGGGGRAATREASQVRAAEGASGGRAGGIARPRPASRSHPSRRSILRALRTMCSVQPETQAGGNAVTEKR